LDILKHQNTIRAAKREPNIDQIDPSLLTNPNLAPSAFELVLATEPLPLPLLLELDLVVVGGGVIVPVVLELNVVVMITPPGFEDTLVVDETKETGPPGSTLPVVGVVAGGPVLIGAHVGFVQNPSIYDRKALLVV